MIFYFREDAKAAINEQINYQGRLLDSTGGVVPDGTYNMRFKIYSGGDGVLGGGDETLEWTETRQNSASQGVTVRNGYYSVNLGSITSFGTSVDWNTSTLWISVDVAGTGSGGSPTYDGELSPFKRLAAVPYALNSSLFNGLQSTNFVQLAQGVQTDSSASNASIFINKTGATADILNLQRAGTSVLLIGNGGSATFKTTTDSTTGFQINDADGGTPVFNVDTTNERVGIGTTSPATALDVNGTATATLFSGSGASLTSLNASNISSGTLADGRLSANVSLLGSSISGSEIVDSTIEEVDLEVTNTPTDNYVLTYDSASGGFTWEVDDDTPSGSAGGDLTGTYPNPTIAANSVALTTDTTGNYVANVTGNSQIAVGGSAGEGWTPTLSIQGDSIGDTQLQYNTGQDLTTSSSPSFGGLTVDTDTLFVDGSGNEVGIGTASPTASLQVDGQLLVGSGEPVLNSLLPGIIDLSVVKEGTNANQGFGVYSANASDSGNFYGIRGRGTQSAPDETLDGDRIFSVGAAGYNSSDLPGVVSGSQGSLNFIQDAASTSTNAPLAITFNTENIERLRITSSGNVGVGTASPEALFEVEGDEATNATIVLDADEGDDATDTWFVSSLAADNSLSFRNDATEVANLTSSGSLQIDGTLSANAVTGDGSGLTALDAGDISSGTLGTARLSGSYTGITGVGTIATGTWQGTAITDTYVNDTLTVGSGGTVDWSALNNYPAACSAGSAITALGDSPTCSAFAAASTITLQNAYNTTSGNTITTTDGRDLSITLANTTTDPNFIVNIATSAGGKFAVQNNSTDAFRVDSSGIDLVDVDVADFTGATVTFDTDEITDAEVVNALTIAGGNIDSATTIDKDPVITLGTDLSGNVTLSNLASGTLNATIGANAVALTTDTTGNYVQSANTSVLTGLTGGSAGSEGAALTLGFDYSQALSGDPALAANAGVFGQSGLVFEGSTANTAETFLAVTNPTADRTITFPDTSGEVSLLGSSISGSEIVDNNIEEVDLEVTNTPTDNYILTYDSASGGFTWEVDQNTTYSAGNDLDLSGTTFDIESQLDSVSTISRASSNLTLQTTTSGDVNVSPAGDFNVDSNTLYVDSSANSVGIGTSSPNQELQVNGQQVIGPGNAFMEGVLPGFTQFSINNEEQYAIQAFQVHSADAAESGGFFAARGRGTLASPTQSQSGDAIFQIGATGYTTSNAPANLSGTNPSILFVQDAASTATTAPTAIVFRPNSSSESLRIASDGNVGIRNSSPAVPLDVDAGSNSSGIRVRGLDEAAEIGDIFVDSAGQLVISNVAGTDTAAHLDLRSEDENYGVVIRESDGTGTTTFANMFVTDTTVDYLNINVNNTASTLGLVVDDDDQVGIGVANPTVKLDVAGYISSTGQITGNELFWTTTATQGTGFQVCYTGSNPYRPVRCTSSKRYKENITDLKLGGLSTVNQLQPREYDRKQGGNHEIGFIAEEAAEISEDLITREDGEIVSFQYSNYTAVLTKAIQELDDKVEKISKTKGGAGGANASSSEITELSEKVDDLTKRLDEIAPESDGAVQGLSTINQNQMPLSSGIFGAIAGALAVALYVSRKKEKQPKQKAVPFRLY